MADQNPKPASNRANSTGSRGLSFMVELNPDYSTLEVHDIEALPEVVPNNDTALPEVDPSSYPEAIRISTDPPTCTVVDTGVAQERTTTNSRKWLWVVLTTVFFSIGIGVGVGVSVGVFREESPAGTNNNTLIPGQINEISSLAAANYTDSKGHEHSQVYYQDESLQIWMADWNKSTNAWSLSPVQAKDNTTAIYPKNGTAIAAYNYYPKDNPDYSSDFKCVFMENSGQIRIVWAFDRNAKDWKMDDSKIGRVRSSENSILAGYMRQCPIGECVQLEFTVYTGFYGTLNIKYPKRDYDGYFLPAGVTADPGATVAIVPFPKRPKEGSDEKRAVLYLRDGNGRLVEIFQPSGNGTATKWYTSNMTAVDSLPIDKGSKIAAMSNMDEDGYMTVQVLTSKSDGGVRMAYLKNGEWRSVDSVKGMDNVLPLSPVAATQLGRLYVFERGPRIVEWARVDGEVPTFSRVGVVNTTGA